MRIVSVNASFAPLTVLSDSGADGPRFSPVFVSKQSARKQHDAEAVHELLRRRCGVLRPRDRGAPDRAGLRLLQQRLPPVRPEIFAERPEHQLCNVPAGGQPVDKKGRQPFAARLHRMLFKIRRVLKKSPYFLRPHTPHLSHFVTILPPDCKIYSIPFASVHGMCYDKLKWYF